MKLSDIGKQITSLVNILLFFYLDWHCSIFGYLSIGIQRKNLTHSKAITKGEMNSLKSV